MSFKHSVTTEYFARGAKERVVSPEIEGTAELNINETVAGSATDQLIVATLDQSATKSFFIVSDQDLTFETNSSSGPTDVIALQANVPYIWTTELNSYNTFLITADITAIYLTNAGGTLANFKLRALTDATP